MKHYKAIGVLAVLVLAAAAAGCQPIEVTARDTIAGAAGFLHNDQGTGVQDKYKASCQANSHQEVCVAINRLIDAQHLLGDALKVYCAGPEFDSGGKCNPPRDKAVKGQAAAKLQAAVAQLNSLVNDVKGLVGR